MAMVTDTTEADTWYYALAQAENLHKIYAASSEPSYTGHRELQETWNPASQSLLPKPYCYTVESTTTSCQQQAT